MADETIVKQYETIYKRENLKLILRFASVKTRMEMHALYGLLIVGWGFTFLVLATVYQQIFPDGPVAEQLSFLLGPAERLSIWRCTVVAISAIIALIMMLLYTVHVRFCTLYSEEEQNKIQQQIADKMDALITPSDLRSLLPAADETIMETVKKRSRKNKFYASMMFASADRRRKMSQLPLP